MGQCITLVVSDKKSLRVKLTWNALCRIEKELGKCPTQVFREMEHDVSAVAIRTVLKCGLEGGSDGKAVFNDKQVGQIIDDAGIDNVAKIIGEAAELAFPTAEKEADGGGEKNDESDGETSNEEPHS